MILQTNDIHRKACVAIFRSDKNRFQDKKDNKRQVGHFIMIKGKLNQGNLTPLNIYAPSQ